MERRREGEREGDGRKKEGRGEGKWERMKRKERSEGSRTYTLTPGTSEGAVSHQISFLNGV